MWMHRVGGTAVLTMDLVKERPRACTLIAIEVLTVVEVGLRFFFFSSRRRHTRFDCDWSSDVCSSDLVVGPRGSCVDVVVWSRQGSDMAEGPNISQLLHELAAGRPEALDRLMPIVYNELHRLAHRQLRGEDEGHTLNTTALVHETYLRLAGIDQIQWKDRAHFFAVASRLM